MLLPFIPGIGLLQWEKEITKGKSITNPKQRSKLPKGRIMLPYVIFGSIYQVAFLSTRGNYSRLTCKPVFLWGEGFYWPGPTTAHLISITHLTQPANRLLLTLQPCSSLPPISSATVLLNWRSQEKLEQATDFLAHCKLIYLSLDELIFQCIISMNRLN